MKNWFLFLLFSLVFLSASLSSCEKDKLSINKGPCEKYQDAMSDVIYAAEKANDYALDAYYSIELEDAHFYADMAASYAKEAEEYADDAQNYAKKCGCEEGDDYAEDAEYYASVARDYALDAYYSNDLGDVQFYAELAAEEARDCEDEASSGEDVCE